MHDGDSSEVGASRFAIQDVHRIGILDVRLFNTDRHAGKRFESLKSKIANTSPMRTCRPPAVACKLCASQSQGALVHERCEEPTHSWCSLVSTTTAFEAPRACSSTGNMLVVRPRGGGRGGSSSGLDRFEDARAELCPIDHGFCLPEALEPPFFEWLHWPQV